MGHVQTTIRKLITWAQVHDLAFRHHKPDWNVLLTLTVDSPFFPNIHHSNEGQLTAVKLEHLLAVIADCITGSFFYPQLSKQCICWPVSPDHMAGSGIDQLSLSTFWNYLLTSYYFWNDCSSSSIFLKCTWNKLCSWAATSKFWFQTDLGCENSAGFYMQGGKSLLTFPTMVMRWSSSSSHFYSLIGQNVTGEFMQKMYAASGNLLTKFCVANLSCS